MVKSAVDKNKTRKGRKLIIHYSRAETVTGAESSVLSSEVTGRLRVHTHSLSLSLALSLSLSLAVCLSISRPLTFGPQGWYFKCYCHFFGCCGSSTGAVFVVLRNLQQSSGWQVHSVGQAYATQPSCTVTGGSSLT